MNIGNILEKVTNSYMVLRGGIPKLVKLYSNEKNEIYLGKAER